MDIHPPLLNSSNPWATTLSDLRELWECPHTGAVTTRTSLLAGEGFPHDPNRHRFCLFDPAGRWSGDGDGGVGVGKSSDRERVAGGDGEGGGERLKASLNTLGYSYFSLDEYLGFIETIVTGSAARDDGREEKEESAYKKGGKPTKWFIISVTGTPGEVAECYRRIAALQSRLVPLSSSSSSSSSSGTQPGQPQLQPQAPAAHLAMEVNLSCPNIPGKPPPAYSGEALREYVAAVSDVAGGLLLLDAAAREKDSEADTVVVPWGVKTPPYTFAGQFEQLMSALRVEDCGGGGGDEETREGKSPVTFITATNTLGSCLVLTSTSPTSSSSSSSTTAAAAAAEAAAEAAKAQQNRQTYGSHISALPGAGIGGMAGAPLHPLALGNVATLRRMLDEHPSTRHIGVIGIGGVEDAAGFQRMRDVGAFAVGVGTALGAKGVEVFGEIAEGLERKVVAGRREKL